MWSISRPQMARRLGAREGISVSGPRWVMLGLLMLLGSIGSAEAGADDDIRAVVGRFVAAQNSRDVRAVADVLWDSPQFLWFTRGTAISGRPSALARFEKPVSGNVAPGTHAGRSEDPAPG